MVFSLFYNFHSAERDRMLSDLQAQLDYKVRTVCNLISPWYIVG